MSNRQYYIASGEWMQTSMGYRAPFLLCHKLNELGLEAYVTAKEKAPILNTPLLTQEIIQKHKSEGKEIIAVYNDGIWGNILQGDVVVRWMMHRVGKQVHLLPPSDDLFYFWEPAYTAAPDSSKYLWLSCVDEQIFNTQGTCEKKRQGYAYYAHKYIRDGKGIISNKVKENGISLCQDIPRTTDEIADILRSVEVLYVYEETVLAVEAAYCGCTVVFIQNEHMKDVFPGNIGDYMIMEYDFNPHKPWKPNNRTLKLYSDICKKSEVFLKDFIDTTQNIKVYALKNDEFNNFVNKYDDIYIFGTGITSQMVSNLLKVVGVMIKGSIISDKYYSKEMAKANIQPFSKFIELKQKNIGVILAMMKTNAEEVFPILNENNINFYNPVLL